MDNETPEPFAFQQPPLAVEANESHPPPPRRGGRKKQAVKAPVAPATPKRGRRTSVQKREPYSGPAKQRAPKIDLSTAVTALAGLQQDDVKLLTGIVQALNNESKGTRTRIVAALARIFA